MAKEKAIRDTVRENRGGNIQEIHGPSLVGELKIWEVWVFVREHETRFVVDGGGGESELEYFGGFQELCTRLDEVHTQELKGLEKKIKAGQSQIEKLERDLEEAKSQQNQRTWLTFLGAFVFVVSVGVLLWLTVRNQTTNDPRVILALFGALIASGGAMVFGRWVKPGFLQSSSDDAGAS